MECLRCVNKWMNDRITQTDDVHRADSMLRRWLSVPVPLHLPMKTSQIHWWRVLSCRSIKSYSNESKNGATWCNWFEWKKKLLDDVDAIYEWFVMRACERNEGADDDSVTHTHKHTNNRHTWTHPCTLMTVNASVCLAADDVNYRFCNLHITAILFIILKVK